MEKIEKLDASGFADYLKQYQNTICGRYPISLLLHVSIPCKNKQLLLTLLWFVFFLSSITYHFWIEMFYDLCMHVVFVQIWSELKCRLQFNIFIYEKLKLNCKRKIVLSVVCLFCSCKNISL